MPGGEDEAVSIRPIWVLRIESEVPRPEDVGHGRCPHGKPRVTGVRLLHGIGSQESDRVDCLILQVFVRHASFLNQGIWKGLGGLPAGCARRRAATNLHGGKLSRPAQIAKSIRDGTGEAMRIYAEGCELGVSSSHDFSPRIHTAPTLWPTSSSQNVISAP